MMLTYTPHLVGQDHGDGEERQGRAGRHRVRNLAHLLPPSRVVVVALSVHGPHGVLLAYCCCLAAPVTQFVVVQPVV